MKIRIERECTSIGVPVDGNEVHFGGLAFHNSRLSCRGHFVATLVWAIGTTPNDRERRTGAGATPLRRPSCRSGRNEPRAFIEVGALGLLVPQLAKTVCQSACSCADCDGVRRTNHEINKVAARISYS